jgi:hypothetical protein
MKQNATVNLNYSLLTYCVKLFIRTILNYFETVKFFIFKKDAKIIYFSVPSEIFYAYLEYDVVKTVSHKINGKDGYTAKLGWLINTLRHEEVDNPVQLLPWGSKYHCHPGSDRILVTCYLLPKKIISGFYIWYPKIDPAPFILDYEHQEINNPFKFLSKFKFTPYFYIKAERLDMSRLDSYAKGIFKTTVKYLSTVIKQDIYYLTFNDQSHWTKINPDLDQILSFDAPDHCILGGIGFTRKNNLWIADEHQ